jgi:hypothetical protein
MTDLASFRIRSIEGRLLDTKQIARDFVAAKLGDQNVPTVLNA